MLGVSAVAAEPVRSGHAAAEWLAESGRVPAGGTLRTVVRLVIDSPWHTYWTNPGEAGMPTSAVWKLPDGWSAGEFVHPVPMAFMTGELAGYGHEGTVGFPVELRAPENFEGEALLKATVSWLACHGDACVPGEAELALRVEAGQPVPSAAAPLVVRAFDEMPVAAPDGVTLSLREEAKDAVLSILGQTGFDPAACTVFAKTPEVLDPREKILFRRSGDGWQARVAMSPYAARPVEKLELLCIPPAPGRTVLLSL
jgi:DsbC/DsbD-like thiol-disulfide interchange protein